MLRDLCSPGFDWMYSSDTQLPIHLSSNGLSIYGKAWNRFVMSTLAPSTQKAEMPMDRVKIIHSICTGRSINVGRLIYRSIIAIARQTTTVGLGHASLITSLCRSAGAPVSANEPSITPATYDHRNINRMPQWEGGHPHPMGLGFVVNPDREPVQLPNPPERRSHNYDAGMGYENRIASIHQRAQTRFNDHNQASASTSAPPVPPPTSTAAQWEWMTSMMQGLSLGQERIFTTMENLQVEQGFVRQDIDRLHRRLDYVDSRQTSFAEYYHSTTSDYYARAGFGDPPPPPESFFVPYSSPAQYYPPPTPAEEEEEDDDEDDE